MRLCRAPAWAPLPAQACLLRRRGAAQPRERCPAICAEFRRQPGASPSGRGGPGTDYADGVHRRRGQYDYAPPPGGQRGAGDGFREVPPRGPPPGGDGDGGGSGGGMSNFTKAVIAGAFIMGMGTGVWFTSEASFHPSNVASTEIIDRQTPNSEVCMANGYSSMVFDQRIFVSFNPCAPWPPCACLLAPTPPRRRARCRPSEVQHAPRREQCKPGACAVCACWEPRLVQAERFAHAAAARAAAAAPSAGAPWR